MSRCTAEIKVLKGNKTITSRITQHTVNVTQVKDIIKWNEENILSPNRSLDVAKLDIYSLRMCLFCFVRYVNHTDDTRMARLIERSLSSQKYGLEFLFGLLWQLSLVRNSSARSRTYDAGIGMLNDELKRTYKLQVSLVDMLANLYALVRKERKSSRTAVLQRELFTEKYLLFEPVLLPIESLPCVDGIIPEKSIVFGSAQSPLKLTFRTTDGGEFACIFKEGDDVRQDHMTIGVIRFMNAVLRESNIDLHVITYDVTATKRDGGIIQCLDAQTLSSIIAQEGGLEKYLGGDGDKIDVFVKSLAAYTVFTYILCIGDRHLDNIMVTPNGHFFHIDFSFIGREPKPFAPQVKLCPEILVAFQGKSSGYYQLFINLSIKSYKVLRRNSHLLLDYIHSFCIHGVADVNVSLLPFIEARFHLNQTEQAASQIYVEVIEQGLNSVMPRIMEKIHSWR